MKDKALTVRLITCDYYMVSDLLQPSLIQPALNTTSPGSVPDKIAQRDKRVYNWFLDGIFISGIVATIDHLSKIKTDESSLKYYIVYYIVIVIYYFTFESLFSKTPGKFITKTKVVTKDGSPLRYKHTLIRSFVRLIPFEGISFYSASHPIGWHDKFAKTIVVDEGVQNVTGIAFEKFTLVKIIKVILYIIIALGVLLLLFFGGVVLYRAFILHNL